MKAPSVFLDQFMTQNALPRIYGNHPESVVVERIPDSGSAHLLDKMRNRNGSEIQSAERERSRNQKLVKINPRPIFPPDMYILEKTAEDGVFCYLLRG